MAFAREQDGTASFPDLLARERQDYALPPRLHELAEALVHRVLELLFPHFAAEVGRSTGDVAEELAALRGLLVDTLRLPAAHCTDPDSVVDHLLAELPAIRAALLLDARGDLRRRSRRAVRRRGDPRLPRLLRHRGVPDRA